MKVCELCGEEISTRDGENRCPGCEEDYGERSRKVKERNARRRQQRRERDEALRSVGLRKVRGAMGGVYWE